MDMTKTVAEVAAAVGARVLGDGSARVAGVASVRSASERDLVFVEDGKLLQAALASRAAAVIAGEFAAQEQAAKPLLIARQPRLAFARAARLFVAGPAAGGVHPAAQVHPTAKLGKEVTIEAGAVIAAEAEVGERCHIGAHAVVGAGVKIGNDCGLGPHVVVYPRTTLGDRVVVQAGTVLGSAGFGYVRDAENGRYELFPQLGRLEIADDVEIGANCTVDRGALDATVIGRGVKIDNLVHVGHNVRIGENVVIAGQAGVSGSVTIGNDVVIAGQVGIADHVTIEDGVVLGAQCGVTSNKIVRGRGTIHFGTPARPVHEVMKELALLRRIAKEEGDK